MTTSLIDARAFRDQIVADVTQQVTAAVAAAIRDGLSGVRIDVAPTQVSVAAPNVSVEAAEVMGLESLGVQMDAIRKLLQQLIDTLKLPTTKTLTYSDGGSATVTETR